MVYDISICRSKDIVALTGSLVEDEKIGQPTAVLPAERTFYFLIIGRVYLDSVTLKVLQVVCRFESCMKSDVCFGSVCRKAVEIESEVDVKRGGSIDIIIIYIRQSRGSLYTVVKCRTISTPID